MSRRAIAFAYADPKTPSPGRRAVAGALVLAVALAVAFVIGKGAVTVAASTQTSSAWVVSKPTGTVTLIDGDTGRASAGVVLSGAAGHPLQVSQDGDSVLVYDPQTGRVTRIDGTHLTAGMAHDVVSGVDLVAGGGNAYLVDYASGSITPVNASTGMPAGAAIALTAPLGHGAVDNSGTLWIPNDRTGTVAAVTPQGVSHSIDIGDPGGSSDLTVSIVDDMPAVVDGAHHRAYALTESGVKWTAVLPLDGTTAVVPAQQTGGQLPVLSPDTGQVALVSMRDGSVTSCPPTATSPGTKLGAPIINAGRLYVPDFTAGNVLAYSTQNGTWATPLPVTTGGAPFDTVSRNGVLYFNDPNSSHVVVVGTDGTAQSVSKSAPALPGVTPAPSATPLLGSPSHAGSGRGPRTSGSGPAGGRGPGGGSSHGQGGPSAPPRRTQPPGPSQPPPTQPPPSHAATPTPTPTSPASSPPLGPVAVKATAGDGYIDITWATQPGGGHISSFSVRWQAGTTSGSKSVSAGARSARITGLDCGSAYRFTVVAVGDRGQEAPSGPTPQVRPCVAPSAPRNVTAHGDSTGAIHVSWDGSGSQYVLSASGPTSPSGQTASTSYTFAAGSLRFLGRYTVTVRARNAAGQSSGVSVTVTAGPPSRNFTADFRLTRTDPVNPCLDVPHCAGSIRKDATHQSAQLGTLPQGDTVPGYCYRSGQLIRNDNGASSTRWILIQHGSVTGFVSTMWLGGPNAYSGLPSCPSGYTPS